MYSLVKAIGAGRMTNGGDLLRNISAEIASRLEAMRPLVEEYERLLSAADALGSNGVPARSPAVLPDAGYVSETDPSSALTRPDSEVVVEPPVLPRRRSSRRGSAAGTITRAGSARAEEEQVTRPAILAALEHGSHTVSELAVVTALTPQSLRESLRRLLTAGTITRTRREGKTAYALSAPR